MKASTLPLLSLPLLLTSLAHAQPAPEPPPPPPPPALPATAPAATPPAAPPPAATPPAAATPVAPPAAPAAAAAPAPGAAPAAPGAPAKPAEDEDEEGSIVIHSTRPADMQQFANESLEEIRVGQTKSRYALNLFGDLSLGAASRSEGAANKPDPAFAVGVFDMLFTANLMADMQAVSEVTFSYQPNNPLAELERLHIRWKPSRYFFLEVGRFHTDFGYWNVAYHHGKWLQLPIERPRTIRLHGGLVAMHMVGAQAGTSIPVGKGAINFVASTGSAHDQLGSGHAGHGAAFNPIGAVHAKLETDSIGIRELHVGVSGMYAHIPAEPAFTRPGLPDVGIGEYVGGAHIAFPSLPFSFLSEAYMIQHSVKSSSRSPEAGSKWRSLGIFAMAGYNIGKFTPYLKGEWVRSERSTLLPDPLWVPEPKGTGDLDVAMGLLEGTAGLRIDASTWSALKLEYRLTTGDGNRREAAPHPAVHTGTINWSFGI